MVLWERCIRWLENCSDFGRECIGNWKWSLLSSSMPSFDMMNSSCWNSCLSWVLVGLGLGLENSDEDFSMMLGGRWIRWSENCSAFGRECIGDWLKMESVYSEVDWVSTWCHKVIMLVCCERKKWFLLFISVLLWLTPHSLCCFFLKVMQNKNCLDSPNGDGTIHCGNTKYDACLAQAFLSRRCPGLDWNLECGR